MAQLPGVLVTSFPVTQVRASIPLFACTALQAAYPEQHKVHNDLSDCAPPT